MTRVSKVGSARFIPFTFVVTFSAQALASPSPPPQQHLDKANTGTRAESPYQRHADARRVTIFTPAFATSVGQRKSINALTGRELMSLRRGVAQMKAWNSAPRGSADFRRSWVYWANMHNHFGSSCSGPVAGTDMGGVQQFTALPGSETDTWCQCQHSNDRFLTWHRMFLWYFERVLQAAAGDPALRLPFWDYASNPNLPAAYRDPTYVNEAGQTVPNPLRVEARTPALNAGTTGLSAGVRTAAGAMPAPGFMQFSVAIEQTPHGAVHCTLARGGCPSGGLMGAVPASALDPIFYAHHTNIDRLYECWLRVNEPARLPTNQAHLNTQFVFVDADGSTPRRRVGDMLRSSELGYTYSRGGDCQTITTEAVVASSAVQPAATEAAAMSGMSFQLAGPTRLERGVTTVPITVPSAMMSTEVVPSAERRYYVVIDGLKFDDPPGVLYNVYLKGDGGRREQIGVINFFNFSPPGKTDHAEHAGSAGHYEFDATDAIKRLAIGAAAQPSLVFEPTTGLADSSLKSAVNQMNQQANVRFESARIEAAGAP
jgi:Common central domain of tyrosinase/Polyphenol oxidase middle domain